MVVNDWDLLAGLNKRIQGYAPNGQTLPDISVPLSIHGVAFDMRCTCFAKDGICAHIVPVDTDMTPRYFGFVAIFITSIGKTKIVNQYFPL